MFGLTAVQFAFAVETMTWLVAGAIAGVVAGLTFARVVFWRPIPEDDLAADSEYRPLVERYRNSEGQL